MRTRTSIISILVAGLLAASAVTVAAQTEAGPGNASAGCDGPLIEPGVHEGIHDEDGVALAYRVVVPDGYADRAPAPLILKLAAGGGGLDIAFKRWHPYLDEAESVFVVAEQHGAFKKDPETLVALIDELIAGYCIDQRRVHAMGASSSTYTMAILACHAPDRIASFFVGIAGFSYACTPQRPVPFIATTGDTDRKAVTKSVEAWADAYACGPDTVVEDLGSDVTRTSYQGCLADIVLYDVEGAGHGFIREECRDAGGACIQNDVFDEVRDVEEFFAEHPLPA